MRHKNASYIYRVEMKQVLTIKFKKMIEKRLFLKALAIVEAYHEQTMERAKAIKEIENCKVIRVVRNLNDVQPTDKVICIFKHSASAFTKNAEYEVHRTDNYRFMIENNNGVRKWMYKTNQHFQLI